MEEMRRKWREEKGKRSRLPIHISVYATDSMRSTEWCFHCNIIACFGSLRVSRIGHAVIRDKLVIRSEATHYLQRSKSYHRTPPAMFLYNY